jgi:hypothetical protein
MELDCVMYDIVVFECVKQDEPYPIIVKIKEPPMTLSLSKTGGWNSYDSAKCVIFPKGKTTWEGFVPPGKFKDGDILFVKATYSWIIIYKESENEGELYKYVGIPVGIPDYPDYTFMVYDCNPLCCKDDISEIRLATEEEKKKLFDAIKENGYKWNSETKTLEKVIQPKFKVGDIIQDIIGICKVKITEVNIEDEYYLYKSLNINGIGGISFNRQDDWELVSTKFDITTLVPFESRVLVRDTVKEIWKPDFFGCLYDSKECPFMVVGGIRWKYCIPYEGNEHLLGKTDDCEEYYKIWE